MAHEIAANDSLTSDADAVENMNRIRDILFGEQVQSIEQRFEEIERKLAQQHAELRTELVAQNAQLATRLEDAIDSLQGDLGSVKIQLREEVTQTIRLAESDQLARMQKSEQDLNNNIDALRSAGAQQQAETEQRLKNIHTDLKKEVSASNERLEKNNASNADLARLFAGIAQRLQPTDNDTDSHKA